MHKSALAAILACALGTAAHASDTNSGPAEIISCPVKGQSSRVVDLSTGSTAPWIVNGTGIPGGKARATPIDEAGIPAGWKARVTGARWVQALPSNTPYSNTAQPHALGDFVFTLTFVVKQAKRMPRLSLTGEVIADEMFELNLIEPAPPGQHITTGLSMGDDSPGVVEQGDLQDVDLFKSGDPKTKHLGQRAGIYAIQIVSQNNEGQASEVGVLAGLKLGVRCGGK